MVFPGLDASAGDLGLREMAVTSDGRFTVGEGGVLAVGSTGDEKVEFVGFESYSLAHVTSAMGYPAYYPVERVALEKPIKAVLMDLDGTTVRSEEFWIWIIQQSLATLLDDPSFEFEDDDIPYVSGHSVSEHLQYCIRKYCPDRNVEYARKVYFEHTHRELAAIMEGQGRANAFVPSPGIKEFLLSLKDRDILIGLVTSGLYEKAYPEIVSAFQTLDLGDPADFYDAIITAGFPMRNGQVGTLGELSPKPHPWLYAEVARVGLGLSAGDRNHVVGIEDSGAGVCSIRLAGFSAIGISGGNIEASGTRGLCSSFCETFAEIEAVIL